MKITEINLSTALAEECGLTYGLKDIKLPKLGKHVVLAGPNGAGKSRILRSLIHINQTARRGLVAAKEQQRNYQQALTQSQTRIDVYDRTPAAALSQAEQGNYESLKQQAIQFQNALKGPQLTTTVFDAIRSLDNVELQIVSYSVRSVELPSIEQYPPSEMRNRHEQMMNPGAENAAQFTSAYVKQVLMQGFNSSHQNRVQTPNDAKFLCQSKKLIELLCELLGPDANPTYEVSGYISLFGRKDYETQLSDGQKVLLQLGCALHAQGAQLGSTIIFLDEPENHLHPAALVEVIDRLDELTPNGQIWMATHSVPLIAHLAAKDSNCIWYVENASVEHAGRKPEKVINGLMGGVNGAQELQNFTLLPSQLAISRFLAECLESPDVVSPNIKDPQTTGIADLVKKQRESLPELTKYRVLDFGAGKGRLLSSLAASSNISEQGVKPLVPTWLDYIAYEPSESDERDCRNEIAAVYGDMATLNLYAHNLSEIEKNFDPASFDLIVMCNVLHEILPEEWLKLFGAEGTLTKLLKPSGGLLVVEDYQIPVGELAHRYGFLLLNELELRKLFKWSEKDRANSLMVRSTSGEPRYRDRLVMHWLAQPLLANVTNSSRRSSIEQLKVTACATVMTLQKLAGESIRDGHSYALAAQTYANASIWLDCNPG
jgi:ABC-type cobalamin/Fe3+-siderophores transport system ATPase subunit/SAM-dependent methyltransferase